MKRGWEYISGWLVNVSGDQSSVHRCTNCDRLAQVMEKNQGDLWLEAYFRCPHCGYHQTTKDMHDGKVT